VELLELALGEDVVAPILGTVRQIRSIRADRSGNQQGRRIRVFRQVLAPGLVRQANA
jgi:hypothetical protein